MTQQHSPQAIETAGKMSEALERLERARGHLYSFHQMMGETDLMLDDVLEGLGDCGREDLAARLREELVGRNVLEGRWTFQIVEEFDDTYYSVFRAHERELRDELVDGRRHLFEAQMKESRRTDGRRHHEATPDGG